MSMTTQRPASRWLKSCGWLALTASLGWVAAAACVQGAAVRRALAQQRRVPPCMGYERRLDAAVSRVLILGDSTGVGIGAASPSGALAGLIAQHHPEVEILNLSRSGARIADVRRQIEDARLGHRRFDLILLHVGGNDVMRAWRIGELAGGAEDMLRRVCVLAPCTLWLGPGDVGAAPLFVPPFNWWMSRRTRQAGEMFERCARRAGVRFVPFHSPGHTRVFTSNRQHFYADDAIHPSDATYAYCWQQLRHLPELRSALDMSTPLWTPSSPATWAGVNAERIPDAIDAGQLNSLRV